MTSAILTQHAIRKVKTTDRPSNRVVHRGRLPRGPDTPKPRETSARPDVVNQRRGDYTDPAVPGQQAARRVACLRQDPGECQGCGLETDRASSYGWRISKPPERANKVLRLRPSISAQPVRSSALPSQQGCSLSTGRWWWHGRLQVLAQAAEIMDRRGRA